MLASTSLLTFGTIVLRSLRISSASCSFLAARAACLSICSGGNNGARLSRQEASLTQPQHPYLSDTLALCLGAIKHRSICCPLLKHHVRLMRDCQGLAAWLRHEGLRHQHSAGLAEHQAHACQLVRCRSKGGDLFVLFALKLAASRRSRSSFSCFCRCCSRNEAWRRVLLRPGDSGTVKDLEGF